MIWSIRIAATHAKYAEYIRWNKEREKTEAIIEAIKQKEPCGYNLIDEEKCRCTRTNARKFNSFYSINNLYNWLLRSRFSLILSDESVSEMNKLKQMDSNKEDAAISVQIIRKCGLILHYGESCARKNCVGGTRMHWNKANKSRKITNVNGQKSLNYWPYVTTTVIVCHTANIVVAF